jgi:hypothetical protein
LVYLLKVVLICAMEADRLGGGIAPLVRVSAMDTSLPEKKLWFSLSWRLGGRWNWSGCFGEEFIASAKI